MKCLLCGINEATRSNTHYLTDSIIRSALNVDGKNIRDTGLFWQFSTQKAGARFGFQQATNIAKLEEVLGRQPTDEEIAHAVAETAFSVDNHFCPSCEVHFGEIERPFIETTLPKFRGADLTGISEIGVEDVRISRAFFLLQVLRSALCDKAFNVSSGVLDDLKYLILNFQDADVTQFTKYPLLVTYLQTTGGQTAYTENQVGFVVYDIHRIILMNDFVVQFFEKEPDVVLADFNDLYDLSDFEHFLNIHEEIFLFKIFSNKQRQSFLFSGFKEFLDILVVYFREKYVSRFKQEPSRRIIGHFLATLSDQSLDMPLGIRYGDERLEVVANTILDRVARETAKYRFWRR
ncbi:hypothetical protein QWY85_13905 [Neolewinella lacunae]|uniref:Uncharacterized protein n=1 Tax=Neolewinella lacunae TaxID=1517758 RepID=A0A923PLG6_9BACT|nr:hypothetical protein [Neolewinella lacunae]MBC6994896.1 hypothetical protein [Neolewinella lacunae]MDN3635759.1 hypothetical protein [Neolewinella lacunae]